MEGRAELGVCHGLNFGVFPVVAVFLVLAIAFVWAIALVSAIGLVLAIALNIGRIAARMMSFGLVDA